MDIVERLRQLAHAAADCQWREFSMRVPAEPDRDADLVLARAADEIERMREERDALAAVVSEWGSLLQEVGLRECPADPTAILAARDARVRAEALREAALKGPFKSDSDKWIATELRRMADAIEKGAT